MSDPSRDSEKHEDEEIEITPEMIAAGEDVLLGELGGAVSSYWFPDELAKRVYLAMARSRPKARDPSSRRRLKGQPQRRDNI